MNTYNVQLMLADYAVVADGKFTLVGAGWDITGPVVPPSALAVRTIVPWTRTNIVHHLKVELFDEDGRSFLVDGNPLMFECDFEVGRPAGIRPGTDLDAKQAVNFGPLPLVPGKGYTWRASINGETNDAWTVSFFVRAEPLRRAG